jgi:hypothetical protein
MTSGRFSKKIKSCDKQRANKRKTRFYQSNYFRIQSKKMYTYARPYSDFLLIAATRIKFLSLEKINKK